MVKSRETSEIMIMWNVSAVVGHRSPLSLRQVTAAVAPAVAAMVIIALAISAGCGRRDMGRVSGALTFEGRPVAKAIVKFAPKSRPQGAGYTDDGGRFQLDTLTQGDGAFTGPCVVLVVPVFERLPSGEEKPRPDIPQVYRAYQTTPFKADVVAGKENVFTFDMQE